MTKHYPLQVGDVFTSKSLANANCTHESGAVNRKQLSVGGEKEIIYHWTEYGEDGWQRQRHDNISLRHADSSRGTAEFVVVHTEMSGGGTGHGPHDVYPDGWGVRAKRLADGQYDEDGEEVFFRQSGSFTNMLLDVIKVREMKMSFTGA